MIPKNRLGRVLLTKLKVYKGRSTDHAAQTAGRAQGRELISTLTKRWLTKTPEFLGTGRRKTAVARVRLATGSGKITVNGRAFDNYFPLETLRSTVSQPLTVTGTADKLDVKVNVTGGGPNGQAGAVRHGIARALARVRRQPSSRAQGGRLPDARSAHEASARNTASRAPASASSSASVNRTGTFPTPLANAGGVFCFDHELSLTSRFDRVIS